MLDLLALEQEGAYLLIRHTGLCAIATSPTAVSPSLAAFGARSGDQKYRACLGHDGAQGLEESPLNAPAPAHALAQSDDVCSPQVRTINHLRCYVLTDLV
jgi:hypothetical protein